ncbi:MAG: aspartate aminotransferase family protein [Actinobacteria bacterium]|nr:aspartate aminotransferase family protein [Actinomycetota bacterium]
MSATEQTTDLHALADEHFVWPLVNREDFDREPPLILAEGEESRLRDVDGNEYVDLISSLTRASTLGYSRPEMIAAMTAQLERLPYAGTAGQAADTSVRLAAELARRTPGDLTAAAFSGSGTEANDTAFKIARAYHQANGKPRAYKVISRWNAYHGSVGGALAASDLLDVRHPADPAMVPGTSHIPAPTCYRTPLGLDPAAQGAVCADYLEQEILHQGPELVAAFIAEPVMQANGVQTPPPGYLQRCQEICRSYGVLFILDEVITGFGRTGVWFAAEHFDLEPDMLTLAKGITAGYAPLGATMISAPIRDSLTRLADVHTFGGHATAAAASLEAIRIYEEEDLPGRSHNLGARLLEEMKGFEELGAVGEVRGIGLWIAVDFTADKATKEPLAQEKIRAIVIEARRRGVIVSRNGTAIEIAPPLTIDEDEARNAIGRFREAIEAVAG